MIKCMRTVECRAEDAGKQEPSLLESTSNKQGDRLHCLSTMCTAAIAIAAKKGLHACRAIAIALCTHYSHVYSSDRHRWVPEDACMASTSAAVLDIAGR